MVVRPNEKIALGGTAFGGVTFEFAIAQYTASGALDTTFGSGGKVTTSFPGSRQDVMRSIVVQDDGKLVAGGDSTRTTNDDFALARFKDSDFDLCLRDDSNGAFLQFNSTSGDYQFTNCIGFTLSGTGVVTRRGSITTLQQNGPDRRILATVDGSSNRGTASIQVLSTGARFTITDRNTLNNTCACATTHKGVGGSR